MNLREWALPVYTILVQMSVGTLLCLWILRTTGTTKFDKEVIDRVIKNPLLIILITIGFGMLGAHFHLSKPFLSFLAVRNFRTSWLSREIVFTLLYFLSTGLLWFFQWNLKGHWRVKTGLGWLAILFGFITVYCMGHIYLLPTQEAWNTPDTIISFFGSMLILGVIALGEILIMDLRFRNVSQTAGATEWTVLAKMAVKRLALAAGVLLIPIFMINLLHLNTLRIGSTLAKASYDLLIQLYAPLLIARFLLLLVGVGILVFPVIMMERSRKTVPDLFTPAYLACLMIIVGEVIGRFLFYAAHIRMGL